MSIFQILQSAVRVAAFFACVASLSPSNAQQTKATLNYTPFTEDGLPLVRLMVNNEAFGNFVIDTGSSVTVITSEIASRLHVNIHPLFGDDGKPYTLDGKQARGDKVDIIFDTLRFNGPVIVIATERLQASPQVHVDGLIGHQWLSHMAVLFDFQKHQINVWYPGTLTEEEVQALSLKDPVVVGASSLQDGFYVPVVLNEKARLDMRLDTGGSGTNIPSKVAKELKLRAIKEDIPSVTIDGPLLTSQAVVNRMEIGPLVLTHQDVEYAKRDPKPFLPRIGMHTLNQFLLLIDYPAKKVYFAKPASLKPSSSAKSDAFP